MLRENIIINESAIIITKIEGDREMRHSFRFMLVVFVLIMTGICSPLTAQDSSVSIVNRGSHYEVIMDYTTGVSHYNMGQKLMQKITQALPSFEQLTDSYLAELAGTQNSYAILLSRSADIIPQIPQEYRDEMEGMASQLSGGNTDKMGDGKLSKDELYLMQLIPDIARSTQCSAISVFGPRSATGSTMTARILDWGDGSQHQLAQIQSVVTIKNGSKSICSIGYLAFMGILTGFNDDGIFAAILDSPTGAPYSSTGKRSYSLDLRYALENYATLADVAGIMDDPSRYYCFNHLVFLSDKNVSRVLENNLSGTGTNRRRALRSDTSALNPGISWGFTNAVASVNSFLLSGNCDNHTSVLSNTKRWSSIKTQLQLCGDTVTLNELKQIASFDNGDGPNNQTDGDIYNVNSQEIAVFQPDSFHLEVAFRPKSGILPTDPIFENVPVYIGSNVASVHEDNYSKSFALEQNYPNPFNPRTVISYQLSVNSRVTLIVYDVLGREVGTLINERQAGGKHLVTFDASGLSSGVYFYRLKVEDPDRGTGSFTEARKLLLLK